MKGGGGGLLGVDYVLILFAKTSLNLCGEEELLLFS